MSTRATSLTSTQHNIDPDNIKDLHSQNIIKYNDMLTLSDYEDLMLARQYDKLYNKSHAENKKRFDEQSDKRIYNLSLKQIAYNLSDSLVNTLNDLVAFFYQNSSEMNFSSFMVIFVKNDRMIYIGILLVIIALLLLFINVSA